MAAQDYDKDTLQAWVEMVQRVALDPCTPEVGPSIPIPRPRDPCVLADLFGAVRRINQPVALVLSAVRYADMRRYGDPPLERESRAWVLMTGVQSRLWGCPVITGPRGTDPAKVWMVGRIWSAAHTLNRWGWVKQEGVVQLP